MSVPKYYEFFKPLLEVLAEHPDGLKAAEAYQRVADHIGLTDAQRQEEIPSGQATYKNRIGWAQSALKAVRLTASPEWGRWALTDEGKNLSEKYDDELPDEVLEDIKRGFRKNQPTDQATETDGDVEPSSTTPDERIDKAIGELHANVAV